MQWWKTLATWVYHCSSLQVASGLGYTLTDIQYLISNQPVGMVIRLLHLNQGGIENQNQYEGWLVGVEGWTGWIIWVKSKSFKENFLVHALCWVDPSKQKRLFLCQVELLEEPSHFWLQSWMPICPFHLSYIEGHLEQVLGHHYHWVWNHKQRDCDDWISISGWCRSTKTM